jgi:exodeoxyribonuclease VII large subunit
MRGGGSLESMQAFNNKLLVREVINFPVPVLTGIGHHKDEPLTALAADKAVSTPTAVANIINQPWLEAGFILEESRRDIFESYQSFLERADDLVVRATDLVSQANNLVIEKYRVVERQFLISLQNFKNILRNRKKTIGDNLKTSFSAFKSLILKVDQELEQAKNMIRLNNPRRQLELGYSIVTKGKAVVKKIEDVKIGEDLSIRVINGSIKSKVKDINKLEKK